jgi:hypothetical protein
MGIEPTQNGTSALHTVLKTAEPTRTLPPPHGETDNMYRLVYILFSGYREVVRRVKPKDGKKIRMPVTMDSSLPLKARVISLCAEKPHCAHTDGPRFLR